MDQNSIIAFLSLIESLWIKKRVRTFASNELVSIMMRLKISFKYFLE